LARLLAQAPGLDARAASLAKTIDDYLYVTARRAAVSLLTRTGSIRGSTGCTISRAV
jgi:hypothetical protein